MFLIFALYPIKSAVFAATDRLFCPRRSPASMILDEWVTDVLQEHVAKRLAYLASIDAAGYPPLVLGQQFSLLLRQK